MLSGFRWVSLVGDPWDQEKNNDKGQTLQGEDDVAEVFSVTRFEKIMKKPSATTFEIGNEGATWYPL